MMMRGVNLWMLACVAALALGLTDATRAEAEPAAIRVGIIGLDTSHAPAFVKLLNQENPPPELANSRVVAAYPWGSRTIESAYSRIPGYTEEVKELGVEVVDSITELLERVDAVLLLTNDGQPRLEQALEVFKAGKPCFVDKPVAASLVDTVAIYIAAEHYNVPMFSTSSLRYGEQTLAARAGSAGEIHGADAHGPAVSRYPNHPDLYYYGIHAAEILFTVMGPGCQTVRRIETDSVDHVIGEWEGGRIGTMRGLRARRADFGGTVFGSTAIAPIGDRVSYEPLVVETVKLFRTGEVPIDKRETLEIYAFLSAADVSKAQGGAPVAIAPLLEEAHVQAHEKLKGLLD